MKYDMKIIEKVLRDFENGKNKLQLSKEYNIPRTTLKYWIKNKELNKRPLVERKNTSKSIKTIEIEIENNREVYNYILGLYLGDGCISPNKMSYKLRIVQDIRYPNLINQINESLYLFFNKKVNIGNKKGCNEIIICDKNLPLYFPQHGLGKKHNRKIELSDFQRKNINHSQLLKGLWVTDGSFYLIKKKYEAYNFTNKSLDIISLFEECLLELGIKYRKRLKNNGLWIVEIMKRTEVNKMKDIVGVKS
jgi:hypothetical protein